MRRWKTAERWGKPWLSKEICNLKEKTMSLINKEVNDFSVQAFWNNEFKTVTKGDLQGKWSVFFFYPADFTFICPTELEDLANVRRDRGYQQRKYV